MDFFISWSDSDPNYSNFMPVVNLLVSPSGVSQTWTTSRLPVQPQKLIIDSGAFAIMNHTKQWSQKKVFSCQINMLQGSTVPTWIGHFDHPIPPSCDSNSEVYRRIETTLAQAYEFINLAANAKLPSNVKTIGVIQGNSYESVRYCAREISRLDFDLYGIGSLAPVYDSQSILERIMGAVEIIGTRLHVFGISSLQVIEQLIRMKIQSCDSSRPIKAAFYGDAFYSNPFRTFTVSSSRRERTALTLDTPLPCSCPICSKNPLAIMTSGSRQGIHLRAIHNFYHLLEEIKIISDNQTLASTKIF